MRPCRAGTARAADVLVTLGRGGEFPLLLGPLGRLLFFRRQEWFLLRFFFLCAFFGHGLRSSEDGCASDQHFIIPRCGTACPQAERNTGIRAFCRLGYILLCILSNLERGS